MGYGRIWPVIGCVEWCNRSKVFVVFIATYKGPHGTKFIFLWFLTNSWLAILAITAAILEGQWPIPIRITNLFIDISNLTFLERRYKCLGRAPWQCQTGFYFMYFFFTNGKHYYIIYLDNKTYVWKVEYHDVTHLNLNIQYLNLKLSLKKKSTRFVIGSSNVQLKKGRFSRSQKYGGE